jgi:hypothetical protein
MSIIHYDPQQSGTADCYEVAAVLGISFEEAVRRMAGWEFAGYNDAGQELRHVPDKSLAEEIDRARFDGRI